MMKKKTSVFELPPKCPALADKITGIFGWRHTYRVSQKQKGIPHCNQYLHKTYSLNLPRKTGATNPESWVVVHHLQSESGILDPDDKISDVADDREELIAAYEDCPGGLDPGVPQGGGDGASGSSVGTGSPDIFRSEPGKYGPESSTPHIEVTSTAEPPMGLGLQVRRGSEPSLHQIGVTDQRSPLYNVSPNGGSHPDTKRWSAAPVCRSDSEPPERLLSPSNGVAYMSPEWNVLPEEESHDSLPQQFSRSGRLSMQFLGAEATANGYRWIDAAERAAANASYNGIGTSSSANSSFNSKSLPRESKRKEPLGQANASVYESIREKDGEMLLVVNENGGPLGLSAIPDPDYGGLLVQSVEPGSRADRGRVRRGDRILEINNIKLFGLSESSVQEHLLKSLSSPELRLRVIRAGSSTKQNKRDNRVSQMIEAEEKPVGAKVATVSPTRKVPGAPSGISLQTANTRKLGKRIEISLKKGPNGLGFSVTTRDNQAGGQCPIYIKNILPKGAAVEDGRLKPGDRLLEVDAVPMTGKSQSEVVAILRATEYGATVKLVVSRQTELAEVEEREIGCGVESEKSTPPKPPPPVLPKSSLKQSSRARSEELLDVNDSPTGRSNGPPPIQKKPLTSILKSASTNQVSELFQDQPLQSSPSGSSRTAAAGGFQWKNREILTLHIPVYDTEKAGLGVSVKGKTGSGNSSNGSSGSGSKHDGDLGIFVKSVLHGGAASRDGRLKMNDQLLSVNGVSLLGQSNAEAMDTLRKAMLQTGGTNHPGKIILTVARRIGRPVSTGELLESIDNSNSSDQSGATVIYVTSDKQQQPSNEKQQQQQNKRYSNPVLDRLTGGTGQGNLQSTGAGSNGSLNPNSASGSPINQRTTTTTTMPNLHALRNESYYMATNDQWSPAGVNLNGSNAVLIEEDPEPTSPTFHLSRPSDGGNSTSTPNGDVTYASQLSLDTNPPAVDAFSRDAIGRRSMSEKHHAALDARETGTYQRNKKLREERERKLNSSNGTGGSVESLTAQMGRMNSLKTKSELRAEALDRLGELGPSLGMKKSSSLESLQTMVQEIQMADEPRGPNALRTPRGRGREEILRAAVERPETQPKKHWLLEDAAPEVDSGGFVPRGSPFQSSLNDGKHGANGKNRPKKNGLFRGIGHMFRFGKHRKDGIAPIADNVPADYTAGGWSEGVPSAANPTQQKTQTLTVKNTSSKVGTTTPGATNGPTSNGTNLSNGGGPTKGTNSIERSASSGVVVSHPPLYQPPPPPPQQQQQSQQQNGAIPTSIHHTDVFNHRYSHYVNYEELQQQISNRLTLASRSSSYGNLAPGGSCSANHIYALIAATATHSNNANANAFLKNANANAYAAGLMTLAEPPAGGHPTTTRARAYRSQSPPPALVLLEEEDLISIGRFRTRAGPPDRAPVANTTTTTRTVIRTTTADGSASQRLRPRSTQLSSDYCRYVARAAATGGTTTPPSGGPSPVDFGLSESTLEQMRQQVRHQRLKVEEESRRHHHYHSQRSTRNTPPVDIAMHQQQHQQQLAAAQQKLKQARPVSSYYDASPTYETIQHNGLGGSQRKTSLPSSPIKQQQQQQQSQQGNNNWNGTVSSNGSGGTPNGGAGGYPTVVNHGSIRSRGPFVTQVQIQNQMSYQ